MVIENTYPNLSNIDQTDFELDRVIRVGGSGVALESDMWVWLYVAEQG